MTGAAHQDSEHLVLVTSTAALGSPIREGVRAEHPSDTPEGPAVPVTHADARYARWVHDAVPPETAPLPADSEDAP